MARSLLYHMMDIQQSRIVILHLHLNHGNHSIDRNLLHFKWTRWRQRSNGYYLMEFQKRKIFGSQPRQLKNGKAVLENSGSQF
jgi:hypothetical protein